MQTIPNPYVGKKRLTKAILRPSVKLSFCMIMFDFRVVQSKEMADVPLAVDMDGTLLLTDTLHESFLALLRQNPGQVFSALLALPQGKAAFKRHLAQKAQPGIDTLPENAAFVQWLREEKARGRHIILCTAADQAVARAVAARYGLFHEVIASDGSNNLKGENKARLLVERFGEKGFDYAGNDDSDLAIFHHARSAIVVNAAPKTCAAARALGHAQIFSAREPFSRHFARHFLRLMRMHQWKKNILLLAAPIAGHMLHDGAIWWQLLLAFLAFSMAASCIYVVNDLLDLENDRHHPTKQYRPLACGQISIVQALAGIPLLALSSLAFAWWLGSGKFFLCLGVYFFATTAYSLFLKKLLLLDCMSLAMLYILRIIAGGAAVGATLSSWMLTFSLFLFLSLAFVKRHAELFGKMVQNPEKNSTRPIRGRSYAPGDIFLVQTMGVSCGFLSPLVLALYLYSPHVRQLYATPQLLWLAIPVMLYWVAHIWMQAQRGHMHEDPVVFATRDPVSLLCGGVFAAIFLLATLVP